VFAELLNEYVGTPGAAYQPHYPVRIPIWDEDAEVVGLIFRIIHKDHSLEAADRQALEQLFPIKYDHMNHINLVTLAQIAMVVEKYKLHAAVDYCLTCWIDRLWQDMKGASMDEAITWVWVTCVFELTNYFGTAQNTSRRMPQSLFKAMTTWNTIAQRRFLVSAQERRISDPTHIEVKASSIACEWMLLLSFTPST
jgi:hypothetical protein